MEMDWNKCVTLRATRQQQALYNLQMSCFYRFGIMTFFFLISTLTRKYNISYCVVCLSWGATWQTKSEIRWWCHSKSARVLGSQLQMAPPVCSLWCMQLVFSLMLLIFWDCSCRSKLSLLKRRKVERLNCFVPPQKTLLPQQESTTHSEREGIDWSFTVSQH